MDHNKWLSKFGRCAVIRGYLSRMGYFFFLAQFDHSCFTVSENLVFFLTLSLVIPALQILRKDLFLVLILLGYRNLG
jgi:hypothetical protein